MKQLKLPLSLALTLTALVGCLRDSPEQTAMSRSFTDRHPDLRIQKLVLVKLDRESAEVEIDFDAPSNRQRHGHSAMIFEKKAGDWEILSEVTTMREH